MIGSKTARIGLIGIAITLIVVLTSMNFEKLQYLTTSSHYSAYFGDTGGLLTGDKVMVAGVEVGKVHDVELDGDKVLVEFTADGVRLGSKTELSIKTRTVLGNKYLQVTPRGDDDLLATDDVIPLAQTTTPYLLTDALGDLTTTISGLDTDKLTGALQTLGETLDQTQPNLSAALDGMSRFSDTVSSRDQLIQDLSRNAESVTGVLSERSNQIDKLLVDGNTLFASLEQRRRAIDTLLGNVTAVTAQVNGLVDDNEAQLRPVLDQLNTTTGLLNQQKDNLAASLKPLSQYATSLGESVASGPFFKAYIMNLLPGQYLQPFIDAAFSEQGINPGTLNGQNTFPVTCGDNSAPGAVPPGSTTPLPNPSNCPVQPGELPVANSTQPPAPPALPALPQISIPGLPPLPGLGG
ncbi:MULTISPECIES: MCE family protein [unclassified Rhodococcus (in: high G+C Gram-positive bacteria)]|uniref:MCE family protein n=1 Tax=unclassified Rhodococcus (in: high G+C Gram-positive bacteria) TaxID=192944 RepID=UPI00163A4E8E|nr:MULTISPECIES: MCE family protein [unclassified Rhodococcus (in: high G+C Gram-positive bacteria)]MBC2637718.1 MCE family protein [Rhodococcus sp. 3A]MBC2897538.1 MCE family protein [Rhodococcus sp. 4CII]